MEVGFLFEDDTLEGVDRPVPAVLAHTASLVPSKGPEYDSITAYTHTHTHTHTHT